MFEPDLFEIIDTRDAAEALADPETPKEWRRFIAELFDGFGIDEDDPDAIDTCIIPGTVFTDYVRELLTESYGLPFLPEWLVIDWEETAEAVAVDYILTSVEINGVSCWYYFRGV